MYVSQAPGDLRLKSITARNAMQLVAQMALQDQKSSGASDQRVTAPGLCHAYTSREVGSGIRMTYTAEAGKQEGFWEGAGCSQRGKSRQGRRRE